MPKRAQQLSLPVRLARKKPKVFGGELLKGNAREKRPLSMKHPIHLTLRSRLCRGELSLLHPKRVKLVNRKVRELCALNRVQLYEFANVGNHLHLLIRPPSRVAYRRFIRGITGVLARLVLTAERGCALNHPKNSSFAKAPYSDKDATFAKDPSWAKASSAACTKTDFRTPSKLTRFWDVKPWTRIIEWGRDFGCASRYIRKNLLQACSLAYHQAFGKRIPFLNST